MTYILFSTVKTVLHGVKLLCELSNRMNIFNLGEDFV